MTKIVYNNCYGGFSLSREAVLRAREISGNPMWGGVTTNGDVYVAGKPIDTHYGHCEDISRADPVLVQVVEELGKAASGNCASLAIIDIPKGVAYRIDEYDGNESVMTNPDYDWSIA